jgi:hypothetical protein
MGAACGVALAPCAKQVAAPDERDAASGSAD